MQGDRLIEVGGHVAVGNEVGRLGRRHLDGRSQDDPGEPVATDGGPEQRGTGSVGSDGVHLAIGHQQVHRSDVISEAAGAVVVLTVDVATDGAADQTLATNGTGTIAWVDRARLVRGTAVASTSGASIDFTSIPSWAKRISIICDGVSTTPGGATNVVFQLGDSGGFETTGYISNSSLITQALSTGAQQVAAAYRTDGFCIFWGIATSTRFGTITFTNISGNTWVSNHVFGNVLPDIVGSAQGGGSKTLSGTLDRIRMTTDLAGTDTFDAGSVNIIYEG